MVDCYANLLYQIIDSWRASDIESCNVKCSCCKTELLLVLPSLRHLLLLNLATYCCQLAVGIAELGNRLTQVYIEIDLWNGVHTCVCLVPVFYRFITCACLAGTLCDELLLTVITMRNHFRGHFTGLLRITGAPWNRFLRAKCSFWYLTS